MTTVPVTFNLSDSWGDGWNGNTLVLECANDGTHVMTLTSGSSGIEQINLVDGCIYSIICGGGAYPGEVSWNIVHDATGNTMLTGDSPFNGTYVLSGNTLSIVIPPVSLAGTLAWTAYAGYSSDNPNWYSTATQLVGSNGQSTGTTQYMATIDTATEGNFAVNSRDNYSVEWTGNIIPDATGIWTFNTSSDDGSYVWVGDNASSGYTNENAIVANGGMHGMVTISGTISLVAGQSYPIRIHFSERSGGDNIIFSYKGPLDSVFASHFTVPSSGGGGDPHINPLIGKPYTLPKTEDTFLLIDNKVDHDRLTIKGKCWYLPKEQYQDPLNRAFDRNTSKLNKLKDLFENGTFFKYIKIEYKGKEVIIDMDDLALKENGGKSALYGGCLENSASTRFKYGDMINVNGITGSDKGLYTATHQTILHDKAYRTIKRIIDINTLDNKISIELLRDRKNISRRNSIKLTISGNTNQFNGCLIRKNIQIVDF